MNALSRTKQVMLRALAGLAALVAILSGCGRAADSSAPPPLAYTSINDAFASWSRYLPGGSSSGTIVVTPAGDGPAEIRLQSNALGKVGTNRLLEMVRGKVEFEYSVIEAGTPDGNLAVFAIPLEDTGRDRFGLLEVGSSVPDDPRNGFSPLRKKFSVPPAHYADGQWHAATLEFDFSNLGSTSTVAIGLRINEGVTEPGPGSISFRNVRIYGR